MNKRFVVLVTLMFVSVCLSQGQTNDTKKEKTSLNYIGKLSSNKYDPDSVSNPYGRYGSAYGKTINNPNTIGSSSPLIIGEDGKYLGRLNSNKYDPDSISNPYGRFGSRYSADSVNNPYGKYGSPYSSYSATNPYTLKAPKLYAPTPSSSLKLESPKNFLKWPDKH